MTEVTEENGSMRNICMGCKQADACQRAKAENFWDYLSKLFLHLAEFICREQIEKSYIDLYK